jgi:L-rhamnose mutarotase
MERACFYFRLLPGTEDLFDQRYPALWGQITREAEEASMRNSTVFRRCTDVWQYAECQPDAAAALTALRSQLDGRAWRDSLSTVVAQATAADGDLLRYTEVFHANTGGSGPMQRGMFALVVDPRRVHDYDARHAAPWPEMMRALDESGFHNYSGFRRGSQVVYYGEFYPDMETAVATIGAIDVNTRWSQSFEGIITTLVGPDGRLITAHEVFHAD